MSPEAARGYQQGLAAAYLHALEMLPAPKPNPSAFNDWWLTLPAGRQAVLRENIWMLADAAYSAGSHRQDAP